ncbi:MAG TPA: hypothetical protein VKP69_16695 [Isosphaeraceae bacterium]|nr:hypothetical protein [Isosphaeraceae bacterium]
MPRASGPAIAAPSISPGRWSAGSREPDRRHDFLADLEADRAILARRIDKRTLLRADLAAGRVP